MANPESERERRKVQHDVSHGRTPDKKKVSFSPNPVEVFTYITDNDGKDAEEEETATLEPMSQRTDELTVLSTLHGRARRQLRDITIFDLQSAVKHGTKTPGRRCFRTGLPRWKYVYGNVVYITDSTSTVEVTSYKEAVSIQPAPITKVMRARHEEDLRTLRDDPQLCTTHSIIIIDQSGSMRTSDVSGFRTRSEAAYGVLALEYIAEQLHARGDDGTVDAMSIIEMNDVGTLVVDRQPLDWVLFNTVLERQQQATPRSHGNYNQSLLLAESLIDREIHESVGIELEDLPAYAVVLLSDGKPSDRLPEESSARESIISHIASILKDKLTFCTIGLGASDSDFGTLSSMVTAATVEGAEGKFEFAQLSAAKLSETFSSLSTTMTATRMEMLSVKADPGKELKKIQLRDDRLLQTERRLKRYTQSVSRWRYDHEKYDRRHKYPWTEIDFMNRNACGFEMEEDPFGKGAERLAYMFHEVDREGSRLGKAMVAKDSIRIASEERKVRFHENFCRAQRKANKLAEKFNRCVKKTPCLQPVDSGMKTPAITFLKCSVYEYEAEDGFECGLLVEDYLKGKFTKYNGNNGLVHRRRSGPEVELPVGTVLLTDFLQAFSHWTYFITDQHILVCDLQGVLNEEGRHPQFQLTDPCICTKKRKESRNYGRTNLGVKGVRNFKKTHVCNKVCEGLGLPIFGSKKMD
jgi:hypothetical protein